MLTWADLFTGLETAGLTDGLYLIATLSEGYRMYAWSRGMSKSRER